MRARVLPWVRALCHPQTGVAADGAALLEPSQLRLHIYNADGGRAEVSGNGARCAAQRLFESGDFGGDLLLRADAGSLRCRRTREGVSVTLPPPRFGTQDIPARAKTPEVWGFRVPIFRGPYFSAFRGSSAGGLPVPQLLNITCSPACSSPTGSIDGFFAGRTGQGAGLMYNLNGALGAAAFRRPGR